MMVFHSYAKFTEGHHPKWCVQPSELAFYQQKVSYHGIMVVMVIFAVNHETGWTIVVENWDLPSGKLT